VFLRLLDVRAQRVAIRHRERPEAAEPGDLVIIAGKGHNGGDGLVLARLLRQQSVAVEIYLAAEQAVLSDLVREQLSRRALLGGDAAGGEAPAARRGYKLTCYTKRLRLAAMISLLVVQLTGA